MISLVFLFLNIWLGISRGPVYQEEKVRYYTESPSSFSMPLRTCEGCTFIPTKLMEKKKISGMASGK